MMSLGYHSL